MVRIRNKDDMEEFNSWWKWAYAQGLVKAATRIDGVQHVLTPEGEWIPFQEAERISSQPKTEFNKAVYS